MQPHQFDVEEFHANMWVMCKGSRKYVIAVNFEERLFALSDEKADIPADEWQWVRCESVELIKNKLIPFSRQTK